MKNLHLKCLSYSVALPALFIQSLGQETKPTTPDRLPTVVVRDSAAQDALGEEQLVGANAQPEWTTARRFATTRVYVLPPWQAEFEQWWKGKFPRQGKGEHLLQSEVGIGLPYRLQLDIYENLERPVGGTFQHAGNQFEVRYALADWGKIPLNPTLYLEWKANYHAADAYEVKVLLGEELAPRWHWGLNLFFEQEIGGGRDSEMGFAQAVSYTVADGRLGVGVEMKLERVSGPVLKGTPEVEFLLGPSIQWRPWPRVHLDLVPLFGTTDDSPKFEAYAVLGVDLGHLDSRDGGINPASTRGR